MRIATRFAFDPQDTEERRTEKVTALLVAGSCCAAGVVWTLMYYLIFGWGLTTALPMAFSVIVGLALVLAHFTRNHLIAVYTQIICIIYITTFIQWSIGGAFDSGFVMVWAFLGPLCAFIFFPIKRAVPWFLLYFLNLLITVAFNDFFASHGEQITENTKLLFFLMNLGVMSLIVFIFAGYFVSSAVNERERANLLLLNVLPKEIAPVLKSGQQTIAESYESASVLFADIVGSTPLFAEMEPVAVVDWLNEVFSLFDRYAEIYGLEKIRTIGDNYMVASGVPVPRWDHALALANFALDIVDELEKLPARKGRRIEFRIGINSGPLVGGVIGTHKFHYDVWGDTVNTASRMESQGEVGKIQIARNTYELIKEDFNCKPRGVIEIKGKGELETWFLTGRKNEHGH